MNANIGMPNVNQPIAIMTPANIHAKMQLKPADLKLPNPRAHKINPAATSWAGSNPVGHVPKKSNNPVNGFVGDNVGQA